MIGILWHSFWIKTFLDITDKVSESTYVIWRKKKKQINLFIAVSKGGLRFFTISSFTSTYWKWLLTDAHHVSVSLTVYICVLQ